MHSYTETNEKPVVGFSRSVEMTLIKFPGTQSAIAEDYRLVHLVVAMIAPGRFMAVACPVIGHRDGEVVCDDPPQPTLSIRIDQLHTLNVVEAQRYIGVLFGMGGTASEIAGIRFQDSVDLWSFVQEFAEARLVTERYRQEEQDRVKAAEMRMLKCFPYGPMGGLSPFVPLADSIIEVERSV